MSTATQNSRSNHDASYLELSFDAREAVKELGDNWGWILAAGVLSIIGGVLAMMAPVLATGVVGIFLAATLFVVGIVNLSGLFFAPSEMKSDSFLVGTIQVLLAAVMVFYPFQTLLSLTIILASVFLIEGIARTVLAVISRDVPGWGWMLAGGVATIALSAIIISGLPGASFWVIGMLVGVNMLMAGIGRTAFAIGIGKLAQESANAE